MRTLETNLKKIEKLCKKNLEDDMDFRIFLKGEDPDEIDKIAHKLNEEISAQIDCTKCGNCCKVLSTGVNEEEIERLAGLKNMDDNDFVEQYVELDIESNTFNLKHIPCIFLKDKKCTIYEDRPEECKSFPNTHKKGFVSRSLGIILNSEICPIVYNIYQELKKETGYIS